MGGCSPAAHRHEPPLQTSEFVALTTFVLCGFGNTLIKPLGSIDVAVCDFLNLIKNMDIIDESRGLPLDSITHNFAAVFADRGLYQEKYHVTFKEDAKPVINNIDT